jgi:hypothetical protein
LASHRRSANIQRWPIWEQAGTPPPAWPGWPNGKKFALVLTHDVELNYGVSQCECLAKLEEERGFRSTFAFVPQRYKTPEKLRRGLLARDFSIIVHDLKHDGKLFQNRQTFERCRPLINEFLKNWDTRGFASGAALHNLPWIGELEIDYSISSYDWDPFEPQGCGLGRIFPFWVQNPNGDCGFVEMPYTLAQDFTLFILLGETTNKVWRQKLDWIVSKGGMALMKTHPDYMCFRPDQKAADRYPVALYTDFLDYVNSRYSQDAWIAKPSEVARYWKEVGNSQSENMPAITAPSTFCRTCQEAHQESWFREYPAFSLQ